MKSGEKFLYPDCKSASLPLLISVRSFLCLFCIIHVWNYTEVDFHGSNKSSTDQPVELCIFCRDTQLGNGLVQTRYYSSLESTSTEVNQFVGTGKHCTIYTRSTEKKPQPQELRVVREQGTEELRKHYAAQQHPTITN